TASMDRAAIMQRLFERIENEARMRRSAHPPADDPAGIGIDDEGHVDKASPGRHIGEVAYPQPVRRRRLELPVDPVERTRCRLVADGGLQRLAADHALQAHALHQPGDSTTGNVEALPLHLPPDLAYAVDAEVLVEHPPNLLLQDLIPLCTGWQSGRIGPPGGMLVPGRRGDRQHTADRLDPVRIAVSVDKGDHRFSGRSSSAIAK